MILILGDFPPLTATIQSRLESENVQFQQVVVDSVDLDSCPTPFSFKLAGQSISSDAETLHDQLGRLLQGRRIGGVVNLLPLHSQFQQRNLASGFAVSLLKLIQPLEVPLRDSAKVGGGWIINLTGQEGCFGLQQMREGAGRLTAHTVGFFKSLAREWPEVSVRNIDLDVRALGEINSRNDSFCAVVADEIFWDDSSLELGLNPAGRREIGLLRSQPLPVSETISLDQDSVILVTGGAAGITADVSIELARRFQCRLLLVGRTPLSEAESPDTENFNTAAELRNHLIASAQAGDSKKNPSQIEQEVRRILKARSIRRNLDRMRQWSASVTYESVDISDGPRFERFLDDVYDRFGKIDGVIHAAGLIEDRLLRMKSEKSFRRVFETKVTSAEVLAARLKPEEVKFLVFFSSISARFGNAGQADYAAANEHLNKLAGTLNFQWPGRVVSMNWGPWNSGMVSDAVKRMFQEKRVELIESSDGVRAFFDELYSQRRAAEVVITRSIEALAAETGMPIIECAYSETAE